MSKPESQNDAVRAEMEQMSTASLEKMLLDDYNSSGHGESDMDELYMAAQILEKRGLGQHNSVDQAWERFREKYLPFATMLIEDGETPSSDNAQGRCHSLLPQWKTHVVLVTAALCALLLSISAAAATNGIDVLKVLTRWTDEQFWLAPGQIDPASKDEIHIPEKDKEYASLQEAIEDCGFTRPVVPQWLPEGFQINEIILDELASGNLLYHADYQRNEDFLVCAISIYLDNEGRDNDSHIDLQKDEAPPIPYEAGGITHLLSTNAGRPIVLWANGPAECMISGDITMEELKQIINSIYV